MPIMFIQDLANNSPIIYPSQLRPPFTYFQEWNFPTFVLLYAHIATSFIPATPVRLLLYQLFHAPWKHANLKLVLNLHGHLPKASIVILNTLLL